MKNNFFLFLKNKIFLGVAWWQGRGGGLSVNNGSLVLRASVFTQILKHSFSFTFLVKYLVLALGSYHHMFVQVVDRPTQGHKFLSREYVQPQWIYDCVNARILLPVEDYIVGRYAPNKIMCLS